MTNTQDTSGEVLLADDFRSPRPAPDGLPSGWLARPAGGLPAGDGRARLTPGGLVVEPTATDPATGLPVFARPAVALPGPADHLRWAAFAEHTTEAGAPGFTLRDGEVLTAWLDLSAEVHGGAPGTSANMICVDFASGLVLDFLLTNDRVLVLYERLPRPGAGSFTYEVPVATRVPGRFHRCAVTVDGGRGSARWWLDGTEVFTVPDLGRPLPAPARPLRSTDGPLESLRPAQLALGVGMFADEPVGGLRLTVQRAQVHRRPAED
ncbi:DUF6081 family protein [Kitasatospora sp. NPDC053057]|uniref:DUF6081 family protein n=1 Tax=Kitasatospora sp. NPDC053057 TaxID=3364062 RepID=UPI0037CC7401